MDQRIELEVGLTDRLMTALYLNGKTVAQPDASGSIGVSTEWGSISSEWKYKLLDPVADALGVALYAEGTAAMDELELEGKLIFDKKVGPVLFAGNIVVENEWGFAVGSVGSELFLELDLAGSYFLTDRLSLGVELRNHNAFPAGGGLEHSALFAGPVIAYGEKTWWMAFTFLPQLPALKQSPAATTLILDSLEKYNARLLFSFHI
jgi:hypothetical protein